MMRILLQEGANSIGMGELTYQLPKERLPFGNLGQAPLLGLLLELLSRELAQALADPGLTQLGLLPFTHHLTLLAATTHDSKV